MQTQNFTIEFYQIILKRDNNDNNNQARPTELLQQLLSTQSCPVINRDGYDFELRELTESTEWIKGKFGKIRHNDIPHAAAPGQVERKLELQRNEGLLEKNHFLYHKGLSLLIWQKNQHASSQVRFCEYLTEATSCHDTPFMALPVIRRDALRKLRDEGMHIRCAEIRVAATANSNTTCDTDFGRSTMQLISASGGMPITLKIAGDGRSRSPMQRFRDFIRPGVLELNEKGVLKKGKIHLESDTGQQDIIDLIADRLKSVKPVRMNDRYPDERSIFSALREAWNDHQDEIRAIVGN